MARQVGTPDRWLTQSPMLRNFYQHIIIAAITGTEINLPGRRNTNIPEPAKAVPEQSFLAHNRKPIAT